MQYFRVVLVLFFSLLAQMSYGAGFRQLEIPATKEAPALQGALWYPCAQTPQGEVQLGPYSMSVVRDCPLSGQKRPLVIISHGWAGTFLSHHDLAQALAEDGFIVIAINHGDNATSPRRNGDFSVLLERPNDIRRTLDFMLQSWESASLINPEQIGFFGFSRGGYTGLVALGARPLINDSQFCKEGNNPVCAQMRDKGPEFIQDLRIKAAVIADPLGDFFTTAESFQHIKQVIPVQLWASEYGGDGVKPEMVAAVAQHLSKPEFHRITGSQHFDFLTPCPVELAKRIPEICTSRAGFDRIAFHQTMNTQVLLFLRRYLSRP